VTISGRCGAFLHLAFAFSYAAFQLASSSWFITLQLGIGDFNFNEWA
jgi:hypothetical protein